MTNDDFFEEARNLAARMGFLEGSLIALLQVMPDEIRESVTNEYLQMIKKHPLPDLDSRVITLLTRKNGKQN